MSIVRINDGFDITITNDKELEEAMKLFIDSMNSDYDSNIELKKMEKKKKLNALENAMNLYDGNYHIDFY